MTNIVPQDDMPDLVPEHDLPEAVKLKESPFKAALTSGLEAAKNTLGTAIEPGLNLLSGMVAKPVSDIAGLAATGREMISPTGGNPTQFKNDIQNALTYQPRTDAGKLGAEYNPLALLGKGVGTVAQGTGNLLRGNAAGDTAQGMIGNAVQEALPTALPLAAGKLPLPTRPVPANVQTARAAGLKVTPSEGNGGFVSKTLEGLSGEPKLAKSMSVKNSPVVNDMIAEDVGLPKGTELSREVLYDNISESGKAYQVVRNAGRLGVDKQYKADLSAVAKEYETAAKDFPGDKHPVLKVVENADVNSFDANSAMSKIKTLREDAKEAFAQRNSSVGRATLDVANAIEEQLGRFLQRKSMFGDEASKTALKNFQDARVKIAKNYAAIKALNDSTGDINPQAYAKMLEKGVPLSGPAKTIGEMAQAFPRSMQKPDRIKATGPSFFDFSAGALSHEWPLAFARPLTRGALASTPGQALTHSRALSNLLKLQANPAVTAGEIGYGNKSLADILNK